MQSEILFRVSKKEKEKKKQNKLSKGEGWGLESKNRKTTLDLVSLAPALEKSFKS